METQFSFLRMYLQNLQREDQCKAQDRLKLDIVPFWNLRRMEDLEPEPDLRQIRDMFGYLNTTEGQH